MSDGPHRSLNMPRGWKKLAERADNRAYAPEEVRDTLPAALNQDWRAEVPVSLCRQVRDILGDRQDSLFGNDRTERLEALRRKAAGYALGNTFLDYAIQTAERGRTGDEAMREATCNALSDRAASGARQVEEHYCREATQLRAAHVRRRIEAGVRECDMADIVGRVIGTDRAGGSRRPTKLTGIDEGVRL